jgi:hypothetical protein
MLLGVLCKFWVSDFTYLHLQYLKLAAMKVSKAHFKEELLVIKRINEISKCRVLFELLIV